MAFVVRADSKKPGEGTFLADKSTRFDAVETALELVKQGITIMGDDGRIYTASEFTVFLAERTLNARGSKGESTLPTSSAMPS